MRICHQWLDTILPRFEEAAESPQNDKKKYTPGHNKLKYRKLKTKRKS